MTAMSVTVATKRTGSQVEVSVTDTGSGIPAEAVGRSTLYGVGARPRSVR